MGKGVSKRLTINSKLSCDSDVVVKLFGIAVEAIACFLSLTTDTRGIDQFEHQAHKARRLTKCLSIKMLRQFFKNIMIVIAVLCCSSVVSDRHFLALNKIGFTAAIKCDLTRASDLQNLKRL